MAGNLKPGSQPSPCDIKNTYCEEQSTRLRPFAHHSAPCAQPCVTMHIPPPMCAEWCNIMSKGLLQSLPYIYYTRTWKYCHDNRAFCLLYVSITIMAVSYHTPVVLFLSLCHPLCEVASSLGLPNVKGNIKSRLPITRQMLKC